MNTNDKIRHIRIQHDMTQNEFAASLGISRSALTQLEAGNTKPSFDVLERLIDEFDVDVNIFFNSAVPEKKKLDDTTAVGEKALRILKFYDDQYGLRYNTLLQEKLVRQIAADCDKPEDAKMVIDTLDAYLMLEATVTELEFRFFDPLKRYANKIRKQRLAFEQEDERLLEAANTAELRSQLNSIMQSLREYLENGAEVIHRWNEEFRADNDYFSELVTYTTPLHKLLDSSREEYLRHMEILLRQADSLDEVEHFYEKEHVFRW